MWCLSILVLATVARAQDIGDDLILDYDAAYALAQLPLECYQNAYPHKFGLTYESDDDLKSPSEYHPIFYGCFDWHSAVHGHWLLASFPGTELADNITQVFDQQFTAQKVSGELEVFQSSANKIFERTYGWAWLLKLQQELLQSPLDSVHGWSATLKPLADLIVTKYNDFLPSLVYPLRVGEHPNTAFGLIFALEYARAVGDQDLVDLISFNATGHFDSDKNCPINWEPSGSDFLSPCLQEADLMARLNGASATSWLMTFQPELFDPNFNLEPGHVIDRTDGKLVHLDGVNFSRAWNLYSIVSLLPGTYQTDRDRLFAMADEHVLESKDYVIGADYAGSHWLASFLVYALQMRDVALQSLPQK